MRRKIELYIDGQRADLAEQGLILWNYVLEEMSNPTIVRNSFTKTITLPATPANNRIFGHFLRSDRISGSGLYNPMARAPFVVYSESSEILESGYCKLDKVTRKSAAGAEYSVTLYGGLGSFLYGLSYNADGDKLTLADLVYLGEDSDPSELDFTIDRTAVLDAWSQMAGRDIEMHPTREYLLSTIAEDGSLDVGTRAEYVAEFFVKSGDVYAVTGASSANGCLAAVYDGQGNTLATYFYGTDTTYTRQRVDIPEDGKVLRVCGAPNGIWPVVVSGFDPRWDIINFAPMYNGLPSGEFSADKAVFLPSDAGVAIPSGYTTKGGSGYALASLPAAITEWEAKDLRSYLQRPVIRFRSVIEAICEEYNNGGWDVELDGTFFNEGNPYWEAAWMTLPILSSLEVQSEGVQGALVPRIGSISVPNGGNPSTEYTINLQVIPKIDTATEALSYYMHCQSEGASDETWFALNFGTIKLTAYDSDGNELASTEANFSSAAPAFISGTLVIDAVGHFDEDGKWTGNPIPLELTAYGVAYVTLSQTFATATQGTIPFAVGPTDVFTDTQDSQTRTAANHGIVENSEGCTYRYTTSDSARTGAVITKRLLLSGDKTPADYLLSYCKMFGLLILADQQTKRVRILQRKTFYNGETIDLTERVNRSKEMHVTPYLFASKWYDFATKYDKGEFAEYYSNLYGRTYGRHRVDTGSEFDTAAVDVLKDSAFKGLVEVQERSVNFCDIDQGGHLYPAPFQNGCKMTLYDSDGTGSEFDIPQPLFSAVRTWWNDTPTWDSFPKVQAHSADNKADETRDTLLFFSAMRYAPADTCVTDDTPMMMTLNEHVPCWFFGFGAVDADAVVSALPVFSRYLRDNSGKIVRSWDFGTPAEVQLPAADFADDSGIFAQYWRAYVADRWDKDTRVLTCRANLRGLRVDSDLLRNFFYYDGALWALNKITNYSLTTWDDTEIELVKVHDKANYTE